MKNKLFLIFICLILLSISTVSAGDINQTNIDDADNSVLSTSNNVIVDTLSASENDNLTSNGEYVDVNEAYDSLNAFRTEKNVWQWNEDDTTKTYFNTNNDNMLKPLARDITLEQTAKIRAKELVQLFDHTRPDGTICFTAFPSGLLDYGENIAYGYTTCESVTEGWKETNDFYDGQGHRRNMLYSGFNCVGIAGYKVNGVIYWVQDFGYNPNIVMMKTVRPTPIETHETNNGLYVNSSVKTNGDGSKDNPFKDLISALDKAKNGDTIYIAPGMYAGLNNTCLTINKSLNITNWTIGDIIFDGEHNKNGIFKLKANINIKGLTFINSNNSALTTYGGNSSTIFNCIFINNSAKGVGNGVGGAIYNSNSVINCTFINNNADEGGAIYNSKYIVNCTFINNSEIDYGFDMGGGGVSHSDCIMNCIFINNTCAIFNSNTVTNCTFINNTNAISDLRWVTLNYVEEDTSHKILYSNCNFNNNNNAILIDVRKNIEALSGYKNIIFDYTIVDCTFINNSANGDGGAIGIDGDMTVDWDGFTSFSNDKFNVVNCTFINNSANGDGGAIYSYGGYDDWDSLYPAFLSVMNSTFINNSANGDGGAIFGFNSIMNCTFINNSAENNSGAIYHYGWGHDIMDCIFINNSANGDGGAIYDDCDSGIINCIFINNSANGDGGAICIFNSDTWGYGVSILNSIFKNNTDLNNHAIFINENIDVNLNNNTIDNLIYNNGTIASPTSIIILNNKTITTSNKEFILNATIYDDNGNIIVCDDFNFTINNKSIKGTLENDTFKAHVDLDGGENIISATSVKGLLTNNTVKIGIININTNVNISAPDLIKYYNGNERFVVTLKDKDNKPISNESVSITINGMEYTRTTNINGEASIAINLNSGVYPVTTQFNDQKIDSKVTVISTIQGKDITKIFRNDTQYYATFLDNKGNFLKNKDVTFNINGVFYTRTTNDKGVAKLNINLGQGDYIITAKNLDTGEQRSNIVKVLPSIIENNNITKYYKNGTQYVVKILNNDGSVAGAGVNVTFNINGVFYTRTTNTSGYAKLNINLAPDEYIITAEYNTLRVSNTIKVLPVLSAEDLSMSYKDGSKFEAKLLDGQGNAYASQTIKFNINGVFYDRTTDANGIAKLNINLMSGKYIITSMYNGAAIANEVTIS